MEIGYNNVVFGHGEHLADAAEDLRGEVLELQELLGLAMVQHLSHYFRNTKIERQRG